MIRNPAYPSLPCTWQVGPSPGPDHRPQRLVPATVPGAVQLDWAAANDLPDYRIGDNVRHWQGLDEHHWHYQTRFAHPQLNPDQRLVFACGGVDYACVVRCNDVVVHAQEGMFTPFQVDLTDHLQDDNQLCVLVFPAPRCQRLATNSDADQGSLRHLATDSCKPPVAYGWDWHPLLIPLGIWDETGLEIRPARHLDTVSLHQTWLGSEPAMDIHITTSDAHPRDAVLIWRIEDPTGAEIVTVEQGAKAGAVRLRAHIPDPQLWWPRGYGEQPRYTSVVELRTPEGRILDQDQRRFGLRRVALTMHPVAWNEPQGFPKSRSNPPITVTVNDVPIFCKGSNWVPPDIFPGRIDADTYRPLIDLAVEANFNTLRVWGGGIVNKDSFYELCDEAGLLVFVEFPLACNPYGDDPAYLRVLEQEARSIVSRYRHHPSIALWCGGNELFNGWSGMTDQSLPIRLLNAICYELDRQRPFVPTFPVSGMGHGPYTFFDTDSDEEVIGLIQRARHTAYSEFGCPGPSPADYLRTIIPTEELWPPRPGTSWQTHHAFDAWRGDTWLCWQTICRIYGQPQDLEELCARGAQLQAIGYQAIFEEARRQWPRCSMAINWCFNEPWPSAANNAIVNHPAQPKPTAFAAVRDACREVLLCARIAKLRWRTGERIDVELEVINDSGAELPAASVSALARCGELRWDLGSWHHPAVEPRGKILGPTLRWILPELPQADWCIELHHGADTAHANRYALRFVHRGSSAQRRLNE
jgi:beta-mannosidase